MKNISELEPTILTIFGGSGDLAWRKLMPALYNLHADGYLPDDFRILSVDIKDISQEAYNSHHLEGVNKFSRRGKADKDSWKEFEKKIQYVKADITSNKAYSHLKEIYEKIEKDWDKDNDVTRIFYMAVAPDFIKEIAEHLNNAGIAGNSKKHRIIVEKPFGHDLESAQELNHVLQGIFSECQIYRIDHYLGKETVQNIMAMRFANVLFEPLWNRNYIEQVQIHVAESVGVGNRASYYEHAGAVRDMIQNHIMQLLCLTAMEPPVNLSANSVRDKKLEVLHAIRRYSEDEVYVNAVRGQYAEGWIEGKEVKSYRKEKEIDPVSQTETFAAMRFFVDNWRWQGVPFYVRTGKRLADKTSYIVIQFREVPHRVFPSGVRELLHPNLMVISIQPQRGTRIHFQAKKTGLDMRLNPVDMVFNYSDTYTIDPPDAYETLLNDVMLGDATLFMRSDQIEESWRIIMPVLNVWDNNPPHKFPNYEAGSWGPAEAEALIAHDGHYWYTFTEPLESAGMVRNIS
ncbi:MAG TPA: glucose-6-phosphate dehydrogenase [Bacteroidales bacterium]|nr:glucose-6-phosphate dehydrogenase [Bacteroidales bacterium]